MYGNIIQHLMMLYMLYKNPLPFFMINRLLLKLYYMDFGIPFPNIKNVELILSGNRIRYRNKVYTVST